MQACRLIGRIPDSGNDHPYDQQVSDQHAYDKTEDRVIHQHRIRQIRQHDIDTDHYRWNKGKSQQQDAFSQDSAPQLASGRAMRSPISPCR